MQNKEISSLMVVEDVTYDIDEDEKFDIQE